MNTEGRALREKLRALEREFRDYGQTLRKSVDEFRAGVDQERKDFASGVEDRERAFFDRIEGLIEHWRRNHESIFKLLDSEIVEFMHGTAEAAGTPK